MVYMTFNSSCSYAGVANMLAQHGFATDDRTIALEMKLPYLFARENSAYLAGPMLQTAQWFDLYLNPKGFRMVETTVPAEQAAAYLQRQKTAMLGVELEEGDKHAIVYTGNRDGKLLFLNNKWADDPAPEQVAFTEEELLRRICPTPVIATLERISPRKVDLSGKMKESVSVIRRNLDEIRQVCSQCATVGSLRGKLNTLFRPLLLDGITMLGLLGETALAQQFTALQTAFLMGLRQDGAAVITFGDYLNVEELTAAAECYINLITEAAES